MPDALTRYLTGWGNGGGMRLSPKGTGQPGYFFEMPTFDALQSSPRKAWAHYMTTFPVSIENKDGVNDPTEYYTRVWMPPGSTEIDKDHSLYGGYVRDRPIPRTVRPENSGVAAFPDTTVPSWEKADMLMEVEQAYRMGLDGFALLTQSRRTSTITRQGKGPYWLLQACIDHGKGMQCVLMPDMTTSIGDLSPTDLSDEIAAQAAYSSAYRLPDGRLVIACFKAENKTVAWWDTFQDVMKTRHKITTAFWPLFSESINKYRDDFKTAKNIYGMSTWGNGHATGNPIDGSPSTSYPYGQGKSVVDLGLHWCQSVRLQDHRPWSQVYWEPEGSKNYRNTWEIADQLQKYNADADWVQITTWNDYAEGSGLAPSLKNNETAMRQLTAYFTARWKVGDDLPIIRDAAFLIHRIMPFGTTVQSAAQTKFMSRSAGVANYLWAEALVFATAPTDVVLDSGSNRTTVSVEAGMSVVRAALGVGQQRVVLSRGGTTLLTVTGSEPVVASPLVQDYHNRITMGMV